MGFKYVSIDIETSGLDPENCQILEFGAIVEDTEKKLSFDEIPKFKKVIYHEEIKGNAFALNMNARLLKILADYQSKYDKFNARKITLEELKSFAKENNITTLKGLVTDFYSFLEPHFNNGVDWGADKIEINVAGKNFGMFDYNFIKKVPDIDRLVRFRSRVLDPAILCVDWKNDSSLPGLLECKKRQNIEGIVTHDSIEDAWDVIQVLRKFY